MNSGQPICGEDPFPSCDELPAILGGAACILSDDGVNFDCEGSPFKFSWGEDGFGDRGYAEILGELGILGENLGDLGENLGDLGGNLGGLLGGQDDDESDDDSSDDSADNGDDDSSDDSGDDSGGDDSSDDGGGDDD
jgi:hypothetical protein